MPALLTILHGQLLGTPLKRKLDRQARSWVFLEKMGLRRPKKEAWLPDSAVRARPHLQTPGNVNVTTSLLSEVSRTVQESAVFLIHLE